MKVKTLKLVLILAAVFAVLYMSSSKVRRVFSIYAQGQSEVLKDYDLESLSVSERGAVYFVGGDFGALNTDTLRGSAAPWSLLASLIALNHVQGDLDKVTWEAVNDAFAQWGFTSGTHIANWPEGLARPKLKGPLGLNIGVVERSVPPIKITASNLSCAACHSSVAYDAQGNPDTKQIWLGQPNPSISLEAYPQAIYDSFLNYGQDPKLFEAMDKLFPDLPSKERNTLKRFVLPAANKRIAELKETLGRAVPFKGGYPGATNGVDSLHIRLGIMDPAIMSESSAYNSIPNIEGHGFRTSFLNVGNYQLPNVDGDAVITREDIDEAHLDRLGQMVAFFTVPAFGVTPEIAEDHINEAQDAMHFSASLKTQPFPGEINTPLSKAGETLYAKLCASCHGSYDGADLVSFPNAIDDVGTDRLRIEILNNANTADAINSSVMGKYINAVDPLGYIAPPLDGIWATAPYFHNGSVPTLYHLFNPETRPVRFYVGGQKLNYDLVGIDGDLIEGVWTYPQDYEPWSPPILFDTSLSGHGAQGHEAEFNDLDEAQKKALIEYLKTL